MGTRAGGPISAIRDTIPPRDGGAARVIVRRGATIAAIASLPILVAAIFARVLLGGTPVTAIPYVSDEIAYWTQIAAFQVAGFHGGYTTVNEQPARAAFSHFGPQGPAFAMLYGAVARLAGWQYQSGPFFGAAAVALGAAVWIAVARPERLRAALLLATFWPIILAAPNTMQESLHFGIGAVLAALIGVLFTDGSPSRSHIRLTWAFLAAAALVRPTWALLAIGLGWQLARKRGASHSRGLATGALIAGALYLAFTYLAAPYRGASLGLDLFTGGVTPAFVALFSGLTGFGRWLFGEAEPLERFYRFELLAVALLAGLSAARAREAATRHVMAAIAATVCITIAANLTLQNVGAWRDYRASTPVLLMAVLAAAAARERWSWAIVAAHLVVAPLAVTTFKDFQGPRWQRADPAAAIERFAGSIRGHMGYDPALSGWGNTVLIGVNRYDYPLLGVPRGMGLSVTFDWAKLPAPARSRYLLLAEPDLAAVAGRMRLQKLADTPMGGLYENEDWAR